MLETISQTDASDYSAISDQLQKVSTDRNYVLYPVAYYFHKYTVIDYNYIIRDKDFLDIILC
jgi:hypothetical protein